MNNDRKTQRKNKTGQVINWPSNNDYFTIDSLILTNKHMLTANKESDITLRVRLMRAVKGDGVPKTVDVIGTYNTGHGRPQLVFAMRPVTQAAINKAKSNNKITLAKQEELIPIMNFNKPAKKDSSPTVVTVGTSAVNTVAA